VSVYRHDGFGEASCFHLQGNTKNYDASDLNSADLDFRSFTARQNLLAANKAYVSLYDVHAVT
jgi:hypothetical protein